MSSLLLGHIVDALGGSLEGRGKPPSPASRHWRLQARRPRFSGNPRYQRNWPPPGGLVNMAPAMRDAALARGACIVTDNPYVYFARHPVVAPVQCARAAIGCAPQCGGRSHGAGAPFGHHWSALCVVERRGEASVRTLCLSPASPWAGTAMPGARCIVHAGVVIGADGLVLRRRRAMGQDRATRCRAHRNDVEIGTNTCIDRCAARTR